MIDRDIIHHVMLVIKYINYVKLELLLTNKD